MQMQLVGRGSSGQLPGVLRDFGVERIFAVTGGNSYASSGAQAVFADLLQSYETTTFSAFSPNITLEDARNGARLCRSSAAQLILAIGGGSAMDMAKCIAAFVAMPDDELDLAKGNVDLAPGAMPIIAVPTTGGTGSEATHFAVVYIDGKKYSLASPHLLPRVAVLDASFTDNLPPYITATSGFDALCQAVESFWAVGATDESRAYAQEAIPLILSALPTAVNHPDSGSRDTMLRAAHLAGKAINISKTTAPHALSYTITSAHGVAHGHAVALTLGAFFSFHDPKKGAVINSNLSERDYASNLTALLELLGAKDTAAAKQCWYELMSQCGLQCSLPGVPINTNVIEEIVAGVNPERLANHPVCLNEETLKAIVQSIPWA